MTTLLRRHHQPIIIRVWSRRAAPARNGTVSPTNYLLLFVASSCLLMVEADQGGALARVKLGLFSLAMAQLRKWMAGRVPLPRAVTIDGITHFDSVYQ